MPFITLEIPYNKIPLVKEFIKEIGLNNKNIKDASDVYYSTKTSGTRHFLPTSYSSSSKEWEYFRNELEFE